MLGVGCIEMLKVREGFAALCSTTALAFDADDVNIDGVEKGICGERSHVHSKHPREDGPTQVDLEDGFRTSVFWFLSRSVDCVGSARGAPDRRGRQGTARSGR